MEIKMILKTRKEMVVFGLDDIDILDIMRAMPQVKFSIGPNDELSIFDWNDEVKAVVINTIAYNHSIEEVESDCICYCMVYTFRGWE